MPATRRLTFWDNKPLTLEGRELKVGEPAPGFTLLAPDLSTVTLSDSQGKMRLICSIPSLDTPVCDAETRRFNQEATDLGESIEFIMVSMDLPFSMTRFCTVAGIKNVKTLSDHREASFGLSYGTLIQELRLHSRAIFVIDAQGIVRYVEYVLEAGDHPNYSAALNALKTFRL